MRKLIIGLCSFALCFSSLLATTYSDKTFLMPRSVMINLPMEYTTWHTQLNRMSNAEYNGTVQVVPFYQKSTNKTAIGKYFGFDWAGNEGLGIVNQIGVSPTDATILKYPQDIIHDYANARNTLQANYKFEPYQTVWGARLSYQQDLDKLLDGLFFRINAPIVSVKNNINLTTLTASTKETLPGGTTDVSFLDYLSGNVENTSANDKQLALKYAKIDGASHSSSGVADIDVMLGYTFVHKERYRAGINIDVLFPTGKTPKGDLLFEPVHGNGHHWGLGCGLDLGLTLYKREDKSIELMIAGQYKYLFDGTEKRTLDYIRVDGTKPSAGYYNQGGQTGVAGVFPLANILTQDIKVTPGSLFDGILALAFNIGNFTFDIGYNLYAKEAEKVALKNAWQNDTYAEAAWSYNTAAAFTTYVNAADPKAYAYQNAPDGTNAAINADNLDFSTIQTPSQVTHKAYAGLGYVFNKMKYPVMIGCGGSYEATSRNDALEGWAVWAKGGISW